MKEKTKKILNDIGDIIGYTTSLSLTTTLGNILRKVLKYEKVVYSEPNKYILYTELGLAGGSIIFLLYKLTKNIRDRWK